MTKFDTDVSCEEIYPEMVESGAISSKDYVWDPDSDCYVWAEWLEQREEEDGWIYDEEENRWVRAHEVFSDPAAYKMYLMS